ncbi:MAG: hypothetical protein HY320_01065 [Armatimonadetes bacterium]|nr:hypothetical protein [Armatimonadota bacterium]
MKPPFGDVPAALGGRETQPELGRVLEVDAVARDFIQDSGQTRPPANLEDGLHHSVSEKEPSRLTLRIEIAVHR